MSQAFHANNESPSTWLKKRAICGSHPFGTPIRAAPGDNFRIVGNPETIQKVARRTFSTCLQKPSWVQDWVQLER